MQKERAAAGPRRRCRCRCLRLCSRLLSPFAVGAAVSMSGNTGVARPNSGSLAGSTTASSLEAGRRKVRQDAPCGGVEQLRRS